MPRPPCVALLLLLAACGSDGPAEYRLAGSTMGTYYSVAVIVDGPGPPAALEQQVQATLDDIEARLSTWRPQSELSRFNASSSTEWVPVSGELCDAVAAALRFSETTNGAFDPTVGPLVELWGFGPGETRGEPPATAVIDATMPATGYDKLQADCGRPALRKQNAALRIDLSGFAKGLAADRLAALLEADGIDDFLVDIGGDMLARGLNADRTPWRIAIERPDGSGRITDTVIRVSGAVATSGDYRNFYIVGDRRFSHTIDPRNGRPVAHALASATVVSESAAAADALATALMVLGPDAGLLLAERDGVAAYLIERRGTEYTARQSRHFDAVTH